MPARCDFCDREYDPASNLGRWECGQHSAAPDPDRGRYPCCGALHRQAPQTYNLDHACVRADHRIFATVPYTRYHDVEVSEQVAREIHARNPAALRRARSGMVSTFLVRRYEDRRRTREEPSEPK